MKAKNYENVLRYFHDGYGVGLCGVLLKSMERYVQPDMCSDSDVDGLWHLSTLLKCVLKDEHGIDIDK